jgi:hypothetical protein
MVNIIDTSTNSYIENQPVPTGTLRERLRLAEFAAESGVSAGGALIERWQFGRIVNRKDRQYRQDAGWWRRKSRRMLGFGSRDVLPLTLVSGDRRLFGGRAAQVAQGDIHKNLAAGRIEAHHQCFGVFTAFAALF